MIYKIKPGQVSYGEAVGIILIQNYVPFIPGDVANATTYNYPVRYQRVEGLSVEKIFNHDQSLYNDILTAGKLLVSEGVRAISTDCGFMGLYQEKLAEELKVPVFTSSLMQIPFIFSILGSKGQLGIVTANSESLNSEIFDALSIGSRLLERTIVEGLQDSPHFSEAVIREEGSLDSSLMGKETVDASLKLKQSGAEAILLECSLLPPYGKAVQQATGLPVFDFITMIDYVFSAVVKKEYKGFM